MTWSTKRLGDICEDVLKKHPSDLYEGNFSYIDISSVDPQQKKIVSQKILNIQDAPGRARKVVKSGDIIFATTRPYLENIAMVSDEIDNPISSTGFCVISPKREILDSRFAFLVITSSQFIEKVVSKQKGAAYPAVSDSAIYDIEIPLPPLEEQRRIVKVLEKKLGKVKEAIQLRQDAIADTEKILSAKLTEIFTEENGWEEKELGKLVKFIDYRGKTPLKTDSGIRLITAKNVKPGFIQEEPREYVNRSIYDKWMTRGIPKQGDVLFTTEAPLANVAVLDAKERVVFAQRVIIFQSLGEILNDFLKYCLMGGKVRTKILDKATGATVKGIKASKLKLIKIPIPDLKTQEKIVKELDELGARVAQLRALQDAQLADLKSLERAYLHEAFTQKP